MKVVNVVSQQQMDCVSKEIGVTIKIGDWHEYNGGCCICLDDKTYSDIEYFALKKDTILTFEQWALEHCKEKYKGNPIVKEYETSLPIEIKSNTIRQSVNYPSCILCDDIKYMSRLLFDSDSFQFATIIEKSIEQIKADLKSKLMNKELTIECESAIEADLLSNLIGIHIVSNDWSEVFRYFRKNVYIQIGYNYSFHQKSDCTGLVYKAKDYFKMIGLEFEQPNLLAIAKEKYPIGTKVKCLFEHNDCVIVCYDVSHPNIKNNIDENGDIWFCDNYDENVKVYDSRTNKWAKIIPSEPEQRVIMSVIAPENLYGGLIQKGAELIRIDSHRFVKTPIVDNVHPLFIPIEITNDWEKIYEKTASEIQAEIIDEMTISYGADTARVLDSQFITWAKKQTKFKIVRNENTI
jgi:hypothetical protein